MTDIAIRVEGIGKLYRVGERESYQHLRHVIANAFRGSRNGKRRPKDSIWAVRDVSFTVNQGEVVGLIGRNGAGKSTLLKLLARITRPTVGFADLHGRIGSLLEVGTGFHLELTGRENVFLSGAILGMKKAEIRRKFDEIVAFAEVERFLDSPLKHYSTGMHMRLAFAVAAHLEPEILLVDEVLAVGDAAFQKKCLGKMQDVSRHGRTILFVSHNMAAVKTLCPTALLIKDGSIAAAGNSRDVIDDYLMNVSPQASGSEWPDPSTAPGNEDVRLAYVRVIPPEDEAAITVDTGALIEIGFHNLRENITLGCTVYVFSRDGVLIFESGHLISSDCDSRCGIYHLAGRLPGHLLNAGRYSLDVQFGKDQRHVLFRLEGTVSFEVENTTTGRGRNMSVAPGVIRPLLTWRHSFKKECSVVKES